MNRLEYLVDRYVFESEDLTPEQKDWLIHRLAYLYHPMMEVIEAAMMVPQDQQSVDLKESLDMLQMMEQEALDLNNDPVPANVRHIGSK